MRIYMYADSREHDVLNTLESLKGNTLSKANVWAAIEEVNAEMKAKYDAVHGVHHHATMRGWRPTRG